MTIAAGSPDFVQAMGPVARELLGEPTEEIKSKRELRFGTRGSLRISLDKGTWLDFEAGKGGGVLDLVQERKNLDKDGAVAWMRERGHLAPVKRSPKIVAAYDYTDASGAVLFQVVRFEPKDFRQRQPDGPGRWAWKMTGVQRVLYRLPDLVAAVAAGHPVYVVEGEKGADTIAALGVPATCSPGGANKWRPEYGKPLAGADVVILPDNDDPGRQHAAAVAKALRGVARKIRILALPGLAPKGDVADWIAAGGTAEQLHILSDAAPDWKPSDEPEPAKQDDPPAAASDDWKQYLQTDDRGQVIPNLANAALAMRQAPPLRGLVAYDEMLRHTLLRRPAPGSRTAAFTDPRPIQDADVGALQEWLQRHELRRLGKEVAHQAADLVAREHAFHPVRNYLSGLRWDGKARIGTWLADYLGVDPWLGSEPSDVYKPPPYVARIGRMVLIAMVARIMKPGCKCDYMLVLEGPQGARKSSACAILGAGWFSDSLPELHHGDAVRLSTHLRGKWLIEIAELSSIGKTEAGALKAFLTQTEERYVPKYGRNEVIEPRQCIFIGTTNKEAYLRDETGGRRFWPVKVGTIDTEGLARDRDQLFAEAVAAYRNGETWWPDGAFEREHIAPQQEARYEADAWEDTISQWVAGKTRCTVAEVAKDALYFDASRIGTADQRRIIAVLDRLGWKKGERGTGGVRWWLPPQLVTQ